jgi:hypothetical protein
MKCRHCKEFLKYTFLDLGSAPFSNGYISKEELSFPEYYFPLKVKVCHKCWLVQTEGQTDKKLLFTSNYPYFSSVSKSWLLHSKTYFEKVIKNFQLTKESFVIEIASNDGYLLKNFVKAKIPCLGIEPTASTAKISKNFNIPTVQNFFDSNLAKKLSSKGKKADLIVGNNVFAHVPKINDFTRGLKILLKTNGVITLEFPHIMKLIKNNQFDTIYHEHYSYLSLFTVMKIFNKNDLRIFNVEELQTHGGSLRIYACHNRDNRKTMSSVKKIFKKEQLFGLQKKKTYLNFQKSANKIKNNLLTFLLKEKLKSKVVLAYGAAAKGNTLLNYAGIKSDLIPCIFDAAKSKQGKFLPGSRIPIFPPSKILKFKPDYILILPWNISEEIKKQLSYLQNKGVKFITAVPKLKKI